MLYNDKNWYKIKKVQELKYFRRIKKKKVQEKYKPDGKKGQKNKRQISLPLMDETIGFIII